MLKLTQKPHCFKQFKPEPTPQRNTTYGLILHGGKLPPLTLVIALVPLESSNIEVPFTNEKHIGAFADAPGLLWASIEYSYD